MKSIPNNMLALAILALFNTNALAQEKSTSGKPAIVDASDEDLFRPNPNPGLAGPTPRLADGRPDFTGLWQGQRTHGVPGGNHGKDQPGWILPYSELGKRALLYTQNHTVDPEAICINGGIPRHNSSGLPFEILSTPDHFATFYHYSTHRVALIGPKRALPPPDKIIPTYFGTSVAYWEGDTLVVETTGLRDSATDKIWLDENGNPTSNATHVIERWSRPDSLHLHLEETVDDPKYYSHPFKFTRTWNYAGKGRGLGEYSCNENNIDAEALGPGAGVIGPDGNRGYGGDAPPPKNPPGPEAYDL
ncbi:MAG: hypothetical protein QM581_02505 [Pseudomonas sp.]